jgi:hypothetical protein
MNDLHSLTVVKLREELAKRGIEHKSLRVKKDLISRLTEVLEDDAKNNVLPNSDGVPDSASGSDKSETKNDNIVVDNTDVNDNEAEPSQQLHDSLDSNVQPENKDDSNLIYKHPKAADSLKQTGKLPQSLAQSSVEAAIDISGKRKNESTPMDSNKKAKVGQGDVAQVIRLSVG